MVSKYMVTILYPDGEKYEELIDIDDINTIDIDGLIEQELPQKYLPEFYTNKQIFLDKVTVKFIPTSLGIWTLHFVDSITPSVVLGYSETEVKKIISDYSSEKIDEDSITRIGTYDGTEEPFDKIVVVTYP